MRAEIAQHAEMHDLIARFARLRVLVVGDVSLDEYLFGRATRLSREAAIPVLEFEQRTCILGGAANPARNVVALGASAAQVGVVGDDGEGTQLLNLLRDASIAADTMTVVPGRTTALKTRILAQSTLRFSQQVARLDRLDRGALDITNERRVLDALERALPRADAVLCSDYQLGLMTPALVAAVRAGCRRHGVFLSVDTQGNAQQYAGFDLFRCNDAEAEDALGRPLRDEAAVETGLRELRARLNARIVMVTRGAAGLSLLDEAGRYAQLSATNRREVYDTTGAGDTFVAVATLALVAGGSALQAGALANAAAGLVVQRLGNAVVTPAELAAAAQA